MWSEDVLVLNMCGFLDVLGGWGDLEIYNLMIDFII